MTRGKKEMNWKKTPHGFMLEMDNLGLTATIQYSRGWIWIAKIEGISDLLFTDFFQKPEEAMEKIQNRIIWYLNTAASDLIKLKLPEYGINDFAEKNGFKNIQIQGNEADQDFDDWSMSNLMGG